MANALGYISISAFRVHVFHFFYALGFLFALAMGFILADVLHLQWWVITILFTVGTITFFSLVKLAKHWFGYENIVYYHHEIGVVLATLLVLLVIRQPVLTYLDITIIGIGIFNIFGRLGCFFVGCCHGKPCSVGVRYHHGHVQQGFPFYYENVRLFPTQLVESIGAALLVTACIFSINRTEYVAGEVLVMYSVLYGFGRFVLELFRGDPERGYWAGLSEAQWTTVAIVVIITMFGYAGYLPLYNWHLVISLVLVLFAIVLLIVYRLDPSAKYLTPRRIHELASAISSMKKRNHALENVEPIMLSFHTTRAGITVSYSCNIDEHGTSYVYALSAKPQLTREIADRLARLIRSLNRHEGSFELLCDGKGGYYIICEEKKIVSV